MRSSILSVLALSALSLFGCAAPADETADEASESSESDLSTVSLVGKHYTVTGTFIIRDVPSMADRDPKQTVLGDGGLELHITRTFKGGVSGFIGNHFAKIGADVRVVYRTATGLKRVATVDDESFEPEARGYGPFVDVANVTSNVSVGVVISDFGRRKMIQSEINVPAPRGREILFVPKTTTGPF
jgi:hypothetical protein